MKYYTECKKAFLERNNALNRELDIYNQQLVVIPPFSNKIFKHPDNWNSMIEELSLEVNEKLGINSNIFKTQIPLEKDPARRLADPTQIKKLQAIMNIILFGIENNFYSSHVKVDKINIYRNLGLLLPQEKYSDSWDWHVDSHPAEIFKIMIYLDDVLPTSNCSTFNVLYNKRLKRCAQIKSDFLDYDYEHSQSRQGAYVTSQSLEKLKEAGYSETPIYGTRGTVILFNTNIIHRASFGFKNNRDSIVLRVVPTIESSEHLIQFHHGIRATTKKLPPATRSH